MDIIIRPLKPPDDFAPLVTLLSLVLPEPITIAQLELFERMIPLFWRRMVAVNKSEQVLGYSSLIQPEPVTVGVSDLWLATHPDYRRQGIGSRLFVEAATFAESAGITILTSQVADNDPASLRFARQWNFEIIHHNWQSSLDVTTFNESPFLPVLDKTREAGIRFFTYAETGDTAEARQKLYLLNRSLVLDTPASPPFPSFDVYTQERFQQSNSFSPLSLIIAADGDNWVGLAISLLDSTRHFMYNEITGVLRPYRGRKIALALKLLTVRHARQHHVTLLRTHNDAQNAAMLAINQRMGYQPEPGYYSLRATL